VAARPDGPVTIDRSADVVVVVITPSLPTTQFGATTNAVVVVLLVEKINDATIRSCAIATIRNNNAIVLLLLLLDTDDCGCWQLALLALLAHVRRSSRASQNSPSIAVTSRNAR
jgi:hypothetical protein